MKRVILSVLALSVAYFTLTSYSNGPGMSGLNLTGSQGSTPGCGQGCHNISGNTSVMIEVDSAGTPVTSYVPGMTYTIVLNGLNSANLPKYGFQFSTVKGVGNAQTQAGTCSALPTGVHSVAVGTLTIIEHGPGALTGSGGGVYTTTFQWTAPPSGSGTVTMYAALNAVNNNGSDNGDQYGYSNMQLTENTSCVFPTINTQPLPQTVCATNAINLSVTSPTTGVNYQWMKAGVNIPGATNANYVIPTAGTANTGYYKVRLTNNCGSLVSDSVLVTVIPLPVATITQNGLVLSTGTFSAYQWLKNNVIIPGATNQSLTISTIGTYHVLVTNNSGCIDTSSAKVITTLSVGEMLNNKSISIYPNPVHNTLNVATVNQVDAEVKDIRGRAIISAKNVSSIDVSDLAPGVYFISLTDKNGVLVLREKITKL
jgi:hypothetical protein